MKEINLNISKDEALVLFEWLAKFNDDNSIAMHPVEQQVLFNLECILEKELSEPLGENYHEIVASSRERIMNSSNDQEA